MIEKERWSLREITQMFLELEEEVGLLRDDDLDRKMWERIRFSTYKSIIQTLGFEQKPIDSFRIRDQKLRWFLTIPFVFLKNVVFRNPYFLSKRTPYLFFCNQRRRPDKHGMYVDIWSDYIIDQLDKNDVTAIENPLHFQHLNPAKTDRLFYADLTLFIAQLFLLFSKPMPALPKISTIGADIQKRFGVRVDIAALAGTAYKRNGALVPVYRHLLKCVKPEYVFLICSYGKEDLIDAAKELGIKTAELQHGIISPHHMGYSYPQGYRKKSFPDFFFSFGSYWNTVIHFPVSPQHVKTIGFPYLNTYRKGENTQDKDDLVLFISQGTSGKALSDYLVENIKGQQINCTIVYKLHPGEYGNWRSRYSELSDLERQGKLIVAAADQNLYHLCARARWVVGVNSTALYEAIAFNCQVFIMDLFGYEYMTDLIEQGAATLVRRDHPLPLHRTGTHKTSVDDFFDSNVKANMSRAIRELRAV